jgi:importin subunit alpha-1
MSFSRNKVFLPYSSRDNSLQNHIDRSISLRKVKVESLIRTKRFQKETSLACSDNSPIFQNYHPLLSDKYFRSINTNNPNFEDKKEKISQLYQKLQKEKYSRIQLSDYSNMLLSSDFSICFSGIIAIRKILSEPNEPPISEIISSGCARILIEKLKFSDDPMIVFEVLWILTNIASSDKDPCKYLASEDIIPVISFLLSRVDSPLLVDQLTWLIANIAADDMEYRVLMINCGVLDYLVRFLITKQYEKLTKTLLWAISNLVRDLKKVNFTEAIVYLVTFCAKVLKNMEAEMTSLETFTTEDMEEGISSGSSSSYSANSYNSKQKIDHRLQYCLMILCYLTEHNYPLLKILIQERAVISLLNFLEVIENKPVLLNILRIVGNFSAAEHYFTMEIMNEGAVDKLKYILQVDRRIQIRKETCWILSNIAAGLQDHISSIFKTPGLIEHLFKIIGSDRDDVRKETLWCITNLTATNHPEYMTMLLEHELIYILSSWICHADYKISAVCIEALDNILIYAQKCSQSMKLKIMAETESSGLLNAIEKMQFLDNPVLYEKSKNLLSSYFLNDDAQGDYLIEVQTIKNKQELESDNEELGTLIKSMNQEDEKKDSFLNTSTHSKTPPDENSNIDYSQFL